MTRPPRFIDAHCHVDLFRDPEGLLTAIERAGVFTVAVTNLPSHFLLGQPHFRGSRFVRPAVGLHPLLAHQHSPQERAAFGEGLKLTSYVGEIGLDGSPQGRASLEAQRASFRFALMAAADRPRFITVHSRGAEEEVLDEVTQRWVGPVVFHWYSGPVRLIDRMIAGGHFFSVNTAMLRSASGRRILSHLPPERLLTETDGPHTQQAGRPLRPDDVPALVKDLSPLLSHDAEGLARRIQENFQGLIQGLRPRPA